MRSARSGRFIAPAALVAAALGGCGGGTKHVRCHAGSGRPLRAGYRITHKTAIHRSERVARREARRPGTVFNRLLAGSTYKVTAAAASGGPERRDGGPIVYSGAQLVLRLERPHPVDAPVTVWGEGKPPDTTHYGFLLYDARLRSDRLPGLSIGVDLRTGRVTSFDPGGSGALTPIAGPCPLIPPHD